MGDTSTEEPFTLNSDVTYFTPTHDNIQTSEVSLAFKSDNVTEAPSVKIGSCITWITVISCSVVPLLLLIGLFGNTFTIIVMRSKRYRSSSTGVYLTALALSDVTFILAFPFVKSTTIDLFNIDVRAVSVIGCRLFYAVFRGTKICSSWFVVLICIERFLVVWFPLKAKVISNKRVALISVACVLVAEFTFEGARSGGIFVVNGLCLPYYETPETKKMAAAMILTGTVLYNVIPTIILICATPMTMIKLFYHQRKRREMATYTGSDETSRITVMLLSVTVAYIILVTPIAVAHSVAFFQGDNIYLSKEPGIIIFREIAQVLEQINYVINFFLYVISNASFRHHFCHLIECCRTRDGQRNTAYVDSHPTAAKRISKNSNAETSSSFCSNP